MLIDPDDYATPKERGEAQARLDRDVAIDSIREKITELELLPPYRRSEDGMINLAHLNSAKAALKRLEEVRDADSGN